MEEYYGTLQEICESLSHIVDAMPGKRFELDIETEQLLSSLRFSLPDSDLKAAVQRYLVIFSKREETTVEDICNSFAAFVEIKVLVDNNTSNFTPAIYKKIITEYNRRLKKQQNIIRVSRATKAYQELYKQAQMEEKEEIYIKIEEIIEAEIKKYETLLENEPTEVVSDIPDIPDSSEVESEKKQDLKEKKHKAGSGKTLLSGLSGLGNLAGDFPDKKKGEKLIKLECYLDLKNPFYIEKLGKPDYEADNPFLYDAENFLLYIKNNADSKAFTDNGVNIVCSEDDFVKYLKELPV